MNRWLSVGVFLLSVGLLSGREQLNTTVRIEAVEGDGAINSIRLKRAHEPVVRVLDGGGKPVSGATVTFVLPATGPSGIFPDGGLSLITETDAQGRATGRGLRPNAVAGQFQIRVTTAWHGSEGATTLAQTNAEPVAKSSHAKLIIILAVAAGAAAGGVLAAHGGGSNSPAASTPVTSTPTTTTGGTISAGAPSFGPPH